MDSDFSSPVQDSAARRVDKRTAADAIQFGAGFALAAVALAAAGALAGGAVARLVVEAFRLGWGLL